MTNELIPMDEGENLPEKKSMIDASISRQAQEVQAAMVIAQRYPRDITAAFAKIMTACKRPKLAEEAAYAYPRGGTMVTGPSIRLAEVLAQNYGNLDFGIIELEQKPGESVMMSYAWDLESNTRQTKVFTVKHKRHTKHGAYELTDPRDIYEATANQGARRLRACVLGVIPGDIVDAAMAECEKTLQGNNTEPLIDRVRKMVSAFKEKGVSQEMVETRLGHKLEVTSEQELVTLRKIYRSIADNMADMRQFFEVPSKDDPTKSSTENLKKKIKEAKEKDKPDTE